jgi:cytochrome b6-f complex iron-sulfur subunit
MHRVYLPVLDRNVDRRFVVRGIAAALVAGMLGCGTDLRRGDDDGVEPGPDGPDGGVGMSSGSSSTTPPPAPGFAMCGDDLCIDLAESANASLRVVGGQRIITIGAKRYLVIRTATDAFIALSAICTHSGCSVSYAKAGNNIVCPCHGSTFTLGGAVTHGPATLPLASYDTSFDETSEILTVALA